VNACIMASSLLQRARMSIRRLAWKPLAFPNEGIATIIGNQKIDEETIPGYVATRYYPVTIGQIFQNRYQVVGKLGFGITSTVWLARDIE
jgi:serine/threonine-protein kinase SRPK3